MIGFDYIKYTQTGERHISESEAFNSWMQFRGLHPSQYHDEEENWAEIHDHLRRSQQPEFDLGTAKILYVGITKSSSDA